MASFRRLRRSLGRRLCEILGYDEMDAMEAARELATSPKAHDEVQRAKTSAEGLRVLCRPSPCTRCQANRSDGRSPEGKRDVDDGIHCDGRH